LPAQKTEEKAVDMVIAVGDPSTWSAAMVENVVVVVKEQLSNEMIEGGAALVRRLDELGVPVNAALWLFTVEDSDWRLLIASPEVSTLGPLSVYRKIHDALKDFNGNAPAVPFSSIGLLDADAELVRQLRGGLSTGPTIKNVRFRGAVSGHYIEDALIYRVV
jgi:hypothetical protein